MSFDGSDIFVTEARWFTSRTSEACIVASHLPGPCNADELDVCKLAFSHLSLESRSVVSVPDERRFGRLRRPGDRRYRAGCRDLACGPCFRRECRRSRSAPSRTAASSRPPSRWAPRDASSSSAGKSSRAALRLVKVAPEALGDDGDGGRTPGESELQASDEPGNAGSARDAALLGSLTHEVLEHETVGAR